MQLEGEREVSAVRNVVSEQFLTQIKSEDSSARVLFEKAFAALALLFFAPFFVGIAFLIYVTEGGPIFFAHKRIGKNGQPFLCLKFRTMALDAEEQLQRLLEKDDQAREQWEANQKLDGDPRITCIGEFFRKTSLDELPQFWNVLKGEMSIVGPRPIVASEIHHYGDNILEYLSVKPGITGEWQVNGRSKTTYEQRVAMDVAYVRGRTFAKDLRIIAKTVKVMIFGDGAQ
ncbi:sugar transferase [Rhodobacteraceae bacterium D3-12]|nr:sugar transferase [Rhodobacteraceae bacterium D3-12]